MTPRPSTTASKRGLRPAHPDSGQSLVEFVLTAPLLFLLFFAILQGTALCWTCLSVQRAAMAAARHASRVEGTSKAWDSPRLQALVALAPLVALNKAYLVSGLLTKVETVESDGHLIATVRFPMPIWMPLAGPWLGERILLSDNGIDPETRKVLQIVFQLTGKKPPDFDSVLDRLPYYRWISFQAEARLEPPPLSDDR